jgi:hypothetical protein
MRLPLRRVAVLASVLGLVFTSASAQDEKTRLPVNTLEASKKGAWDSLQPKPREAKLGRDDAPRVLTVLDSFFCERAPSRSTLEAGESKDETRKLGHRELRCTKLSFRWIADGLGLDGTVWVSKDVRALGIVELELKGTELTQTYTLTGEGNVEGATGARLPRGTRSAPTTETRSRSWATEPTLRASRARRRRGRSSSSIQPRGPSSSTSTRPGTTARPRSNGSPP